MYLTNKMERKPQPSLHRLTCFSPLSLDVTIVIEKFDKNILTLEKIIIFCILLYNHRTILNGIESKFEHQFLKLV